MFRIKSGKDTILAALSLSNLFHDAQHSATAEGTIVFSQGDGLVSLIVRNQTACALLLDVNVAVDNEDTNFADVHRVALLNEYFITIVEGGFHTVTTNGDHKIRLLCNV